MAPFYAGGRPVGKRVIGTEYEALVQDRETGKTVSYDGPHGIRTLLEWLNERTDWEIDAEGRFPIGLSRPGQSITLEPGGQFELSGAPLSTLAETRAEVQAHAQELAALEEAFPIRVHWLGMNPWQTPEEVRWMPKGRYAIMRRYLPTKGRYALHMMGMTCTVQANLDYVDEADFARKLKVSTAVGSLVTAMFANSPFLGGQPSGYLSYRAHVWSAVDPDRCGIPPFVFETDAGFDDYVEWALDVPMFFVSRHKSYVDISGQITFRQLAEGRHDSLRVEDGDWALHLSTLFPDVRARPHLEMRTADVVPPELIPALPALWKGLLYDETACDAAWDLVKAQTFAQRLDLRADVAKDALATRRPDGAGTVRDLCRDLLEIAGEGLDREAAAGRGAASDRDLLNPIVDRVQRGRTPAHDALEALT